jgi:hypothetical protein
MFPFTQKRFLLFFAVTQAGNFKMEIKNLRMISEMAPARERRPAWIARLLLIGICTVFGVVAAFGIAPDTVTRTVPGRPVIESLNLRVFNSQSDLPTTYTYQDRIQRSDAGAELLARLHVDDPEAVRFMKTDSLGREFFQLRPGRIVQADVNAEGELLELRYLNSNDSMLVIRPERVYWQPQTAS